MTEHKSVYMILETVRADDGGYIPCIAVEGVSGYYKTDWNWGTDLELAKKCCNDKNEKLGFSPKEAYLIQCTTMHM